MKKTLTILTLAIIIALTSVNLNAQKVAATGNYDQAIFIDPFALLWGGALNVSYEHKLTPENSFTGQLYYWNYGWGWSALGLGASYRWYFNEWANTTFKLNKKSLEGLSVGPRVEVYNWSWDSGYNTNSYESYFSIGIGAEASYKWVFEGGWTVEPNVRYVYALSNKSYNNFRGNNGGIAVGYSW